MTQTINRRKYLAALPVLTLMEISQERIVPRGAWDRFTRKGKIIRLRNIRGSVLDISRALTLRDLSRIGVPAGFWDPVKRRSK